MRKPDGIVSDRRRQMARAHSYRIRACKFCGKEFHGNGGYGSHMRKELLSRVVDADPRYTLKTLRRMYREQTPASGTETKETASGKGVE